MDASFVQSCGREERQLMNLSIARRLGSVSLGPFDRSNTPTAMIVGETRVRAGLYQTCLIPRQSLSWNFPRQSVVIGQRGWKPCGL